ncbi:MAG: DUF5110 domain-containing protein [Acidobacteria bacterium]|nr:DUF5110 domain-containing protein [Acidobacteriota bacterium]
MRWFQFGAFNPLFRAHGRNWHLRLPWGWNTGSFGISEIRRETPDAADPADSELRNEAVEPICRKYLELRYQLMPYLYSRIRECAQTGMPIVRAMWLHYPGDPVAVARGDQFLWGRDMLIAPVVEQGATSRRVYLPRGRWYDFWTNMPVDGGREVTRAVDLATIPIYVRAGAIIPTTDVAQTTTGLLGRRLTFTVYPGANGDHALFEDDGASFEYRRGRWLGIDAAWDDGSGVLTLTLTPGSQAPSVPRPISVRLAGSDTTIDGLFAGRAMRFTLR